VELGECGLQQLVTGLVGLRGQDFLEALLEALARYAGTAEFRDDVSAVLVEYEGG
jgi:phosphoserine phosphatase RsbU/P